VDECKLLPARPAAMETAASSMVDSVASESDAPMEQSNCELEISAPLSDTKTLTFPTTMGTNETRKRPAETSVQGFTLVHFSAQRKRFLWDKGCIQGLPEGCLGGIRGYQGVLRVYFVSEQAQVELRSGRV